jgi:2-oxo-4-hydroxy-4-carboxy--5-ureidoimidazoline (OHCU) decarboxylase
MKQAMKSQLKNVPQEEQERILDLVERNPDFFEKLAKELQEGLKSGKDQQTVAMEIMARHKTELAKMMGKR